MSVYADYVLVAMVLTTLALLGSSRLLICIRVVAVQGVLLGVLPFFVSGKLSLNALFISVLIILLKGMMFPWLLKRAIREANIKREIKPFVGYLLSLLWGAVSFPIALGIGSRLLVAYHASSSVSVSAALYMILGGFFIIVSRRQALMQVLGFLTLENGIYVFGLMLAYENPLIIELGVLLDVFVAVFVMGIAVFHINREFDHIDTARLTALKDSV